ncbi:MAG: hypothetical protein AAF573_19010 [Bacteroidota bacterium]
MKNIGMVVIGVIATILFLDESTSSPTVRWIFYLRYQGLSIVKEWCINKFTFLAQLFFL